MSSFDSLFERVDLGLQFLHLVIDHNVLHLNCLEVLWYISKRFHLLGNFFLLLVTICILDFYCLTKIHVTSSRKTIRLCSLHFLLGHSLLATTSLNWLLLLLSDVDIAIDFSLPINHLISFLFLFLQSIRFIAGQCLSLDVFRLLILNLSRTFNVLDIFVRFGSKVTHHRLNDKPSFIFLLLLFFIECHEFLAQWTYISIFLNCFNHLILVLFLISNYRVADRPFKQEKNFCNFWYKNTFVLKITNQNIS